MGIPYKDISLCLQWQVTRLETIFSRVPLYRTLGAIKKLGLGLVYRMPNRCPWDFIRDIA